MSKNVMKQYTNMNIKENAMVYAMKLKGTIIINVIHVILIAKHAVLILVFSLIPIVLHVKKINIYQMESA